MSEYEECDRMLNEAESRIQEIDAELQDLRIELENVQGSITEVYSRIVGYYRNINNWNPGKKDEYRNRKMFDKNEYLDIAPNWMKPENKEGGRQ